MSYKDREADKMWNYAKKCEGSNLTPKQKRTKMERIHSEFQKNNREPVKTPQQLIKEKLEQKIKY